VRKVSLKVLLMVIETETPLRQKISHPLRHDDTTWAVLSGHLYGEKLLL